MDDLKCPICGEHTNVYMGKARKDGLCRKHGMQANKGEIIQCTNCGKWNEKDVICECKKVKKVKSENELTCIICGEPSNGQHFCFDCWKGIKVFYKDITHLNNIYQAKEYYYNLKNSIFWINKIEYAQEACKKLYAIAEIIDEFKDIKQEKIAIKDITYLLTKKKDYLENKDKPEKKEQLILENDNLKEISKEVEDYRRLNPAEHHCHDGHYVRSPYEVIIDNELYRAKIFHEYERKYKALDGKYYYPDFYIPDYDLYIEYFGMNENKQKNLYKEELFKKDKTHNFAFIWEKSKCNLDEKIIDIIEEYKKRNK